jgi:chromosomal replication initiator protein
MRPTKRQIAEEVAERHGLTFAELLEPTHRWRVSHARQEAFALCYAHRRPRSHCDSYSLPEIGRFFGGKDHTTVLHGIRAFAARQAEAGE